MSESVLANADNPFLGVSLGYTGSAKKLEASPVSRTLAVVLASFI
jgi:hypothetical protein